MDARQARCQRFEQLLHLAQVYRGVTRAQLASRLGRHPTKLVPNSGIPKLDIVVELSAALDWPVSDVVASLWNHAEEVAPPEHIDVPDIDDFELLDRQAMEAHRCGQYGKMVALARKAYEVASTADQRALACNRQVGASNGDELDAVRRGMQESGLSSEVQRMLQSNLANAYYSLWSLVEARSIARDLIDGYRHEPPQTKADRSTFAFAHYVAGNALRRRIESEPHRVEELAATAREELLVARDHYRRLAKEFEEETYEGIANTCHGGIIEADVSLGAVRPDAALKELAAGLDRINGSLQDLVGDRLESYGWWCIFGCNIALRHLDDERMLQHYMAVFTNKADEIAEQLDNWAIRERVFTMQYTRWRRAVGASGFEIPCVIDRDDVRIIAGTMGRFPNFRETGWQILQSATIVECESR